MKSFGLIPLGILIIFSVSAQDADIILINGKIFTADTAHLYVEALAIKGNRILSVGTSAAIEKLASPKTKRIDLNGKTVVPGFNNAHEHLGWSAPMSSSFRAREFSASGPEKKAVLDSVKRLVTGARRNQWISGDIGLTVLQDLSMRQALDSIAPHHPVYLQAMWGHGIVLNSKALQRMGISDTAADPLGGWYTRYPGSTRISGALYEYAQWPLWHQVPMEEPQNLIKGLRAFAQEELQAGITTVQNMACMIKPTVLSEIFHEANLPLRVRIISMPGTSHGKRSLTEWRTVAAHPSLLTYTSGVKYLIDGTPIEQGAFMKKPYAGRGDWRGRLDMPADTIKQILYEALHGQTQLMMHIVGDSSMAIVLSLMKQMASGEVWRSKRVRIEHNQTPTLTASEMDDINALGLLVMHTPKYNHSSPIRSFIKKGITVGISPDGTTNPFWDIMVVTSMQTNPAENITREEAVIAYTRTNAYAEFAEDQKGTLSQGMLADLTVLSQDIFTIPTAQLPATTSLVTIVDGKIAHSVK
jgi:predicted amidohydrolase YtcJ